MASLGKALQDTIRHLEKLRDMQDPPSDGVMEKLDELYDQQIQLIEAAINKQTEEYEIASAAMEEAASKTQEAIDDLAQLEQTVAKVADAIAKVSTLLSKVA